MTAAATRKTRAYSRTCARASDPSSVRVAPSGSSTALRSSSESAPRRSTRPCEPVTSTMVEASLPGASPASTIASTLSPTISSACAALVAAGRPVRLAELTASGPVRSRSSIATSWSGIRTATVPRVSPRSHCSDACWVQTRVSGPGQNASTSARAYPGTSVAIASSVVTALISTGGGMSRPRPLASRSALTASGSNASAPMP